MNPTLEWDEAKAAHNLAQHGVHFAEATHFNWSTSLVKLDDRNDYGEDRSIARGMVGDRLHILVYTLRGDNLRIISLRKANDREQRLYATESGPNP